MLKRPLIAMVIASTLLTGCSSIISATREEPIQEDQGSRTLGRYLEDESIETKILVNISKGSERLAQSHINAVSYNGQVLLIGQVPDEQVKQEAENVARQVRHVRKIHNELEVAGPTSTIVRSNDVYLTSRIKVQMLADERVSGGRIKVVTENGVVYLMGLVTPAEADIAVEITRSVTGVRKIVKVFEYIGA
ncbi:BON domain-containing protein [Marinobacterium sediminicola]|uniref:Osmotically-inducible protein OsmY, contains BON domain n=1 Tax=Marinobacterium sediminicola TaxID=518898 RepID=A0ABY1RZX5_9GAMM|nr:BON domain-containing protein [Marinobacterium sediminicola]ULG70055.1 BON domain-containing protein [Marinobacterium sediminicola]SMR74511.1 Osmotically-inducible protein OsmY, contains BON domain [Marinobacterium sediminicola]